MMSMDERIRKLLDADAGTLARVDEALTGGGPGGVVTRAQLAERLNVCVRTCDRIARLNGSPLKRVFTDPAGKGKRCIGFSAQSVCAYLRAVGA